MVTNRLATRNRVMRVAAGRGRYGVEISRVRSIQGREHLQTSPVSTGPVGWLVGGAEEVAVYTPERLFGRADESTESGRLVMLLESESGPFGLLVDRTSAGESVAAEDRLALPRSATGPREVFRTVLRFGDELALLLDPDRAHPESPPAPPSVRAEAPRTAQAANRGPSRILVGTLGRGSTAVDVALSLRQVGEITNMLEHIPLPGAPEVVLGLATWRRHPLPVVDLPKLLGLEAPWSTRERLLIARSPTGELVGLPVSATLRVEKLPRPYRRARSVDELRGEYLCGTYEDGGKPMVVLDLERLSAAHWTSTKKTA